MALSTEDVQAIQDLVARYCHALDTGDGEAFAQTFTLGGVFFNGLREVAGREALVEMASANVTGHARHFVTNLVLEGDGDHARLRAYLMLTRGLGQEPIIATYDDELARVDGRWLFTRRNVTADKRIRPEPKS